MDSRVSKTYLFLYIYQHDSKMAKACKRFMNPERDEWTSKMSSIHTILSLKNSGTWYDTEESHAKFSRRATNGHTQCDSRYMESLEELDI